MSKKVAVQVMDQASIVKDSTMVIDFFKEDNQACDSLRSTEDTFILLFQVFMHGPTLPAIKVRLILSSKDTNRHEGTIITFAKVVNH